MLGVKRWQSLLVTKLKLCKWQIKAFTSHFIQSNTNTNGGNQGLGHI